MSKHISYNRFMQWVMMLGIVAFLGGCKKFLEQEPYNRITVDEIFQDLQGARSTLIGCYDNLKEAGYYLRNFGLYADLAGGNIKYGRSSSVALQGNYNFTNTTQTDQNDMAAFYTVAYNTIYRANNVLEYIDRVADATPEQRNRLLADAYAIRGMVHFDLVRVFAQSYNFTNGGNHPGIIYRLRNTGANTVVGDVISVGEVYKNVIADLDSARALYKLSVPIYGGGEDKTYLSYDAATALLSRVLLYKEDWTRAAQLADEVIKTNTYQLMTNGSYAQSWRRKGSPNIDREAVFMLFARIDVNQPAFGENFNTVNTTAGYMATSNDLLNLFAPGDVRGRNTMFIQRSSSGQPGIYSLKYSGTSDSANNQKLIRISEMYLNRAEANAEADNLTAALADLNTIRLRANPTAGSLPMLGKQAMLDSIFVERRRELCFEGHLFYDVVRKKKNLVRQDCTGTNCTINYPSPLFACPRPTQR